MSQELIVELIKVTVSALFGGTFGALVTIWAKTKDYKQEQRRREDETKERSRLHKEKLRLKYLDPLHLSAKILSDRIDHIKNDYLSNPEKKQEIHRKLIELKANNRFLINKLNESEDVQKILNHPVWNEKDKESIWVNNEGFFAISTLHITALYFHYAGKINYDLPYIQLDQGDNAEVRQRIERVGRAFGGKFGISEELHDSLGSYMVNKNGNVMNYQDFCQNWILQKTNCLYLFKLIDFYCYFHSKKPEEINEMVSSLQSLCAFLKEKAV